MLYVMDYAPLGCTDSLLFAMNIPLCDTLGPCYVSRNRFGYAFCSPRNQGPISYNVYVVGLKQSIAPSDEDSSVVIDTSLQIHVMSPLNNILITFNSL